MRRSEDEARADAKAAAEEPTVDGAFSPDGVDLTVIRWMLDRSPGERLRAVQDMLDAVRVLRGEHDS